MNKKVLHDALILTAFTLVLGFILGFVYELTKEPIAKAEADTKKAAYQAVFEDADHFTEVSIDKEQANAMVSENGFSDTIDDVCEANDSSGNPLGYVITVTAKDASQGSITFSVGIRLDGTVNGYSITSIAETPGLGMKAAEEEFYGQFRNKKVSAFSLVKQTPQAEEEIEAITGSTITSKAMVNGCNAALYYFQNALGGTK